MSEGPGAELERGHARIQCGVRVLEHQRDYLPWDPFCLSFEIGRIRSVPNDRTGRVRSPSVPSPDPQGELTWVGHSTVVLDLDDVRLVTDPVLTTRIVHLRRHHAVNFDARRKVDAVLISHVHFDHLHIPSLRRLPSDTKLIVPAGAGVLLRRRGFTDVRQTRAGDTMSLDAVDILTVPARHSDRRGPHSRIAASAVGYVMRWSGRAIYFAGDTDLFPEMTDLAPVDVALLPIWGWGPTLGDGHLDPGRAAEAMALLGARQVVPIHWGTFSPSVVRRRRPAWLAEPVERFRSELDRMGLADRLRELAPGERLTLVGHGSTSPSPPRIDP
jgi:L-ascorbate metabolism protein UlaG (beta-lactamase superfamily)